ncbi:phospholipid scramblase 2-like isoform X2 [Spea bombifrons]|uniref:phospholipid scramblase 2-like isoform X2 n=1 Tax=Spea bombifrons TaxID=233779 RepID=UPI0023497696|nr:phospholipid scramblase 2-like isoform X2 [Spea bombifrons]
MENSIQPLAPDAPYDAPPSYDTIAPHALPVSYPPPASIPGAVQAKGVPPGLEPLIQVAQLSIQEKFSVAQGMRRSFDVVDSAGRRIFQVTQRVEYCVPVHHTEIRDNSSRLAMKLVQDTCCTCTTQTQVFGRGRLLGYVKLHTSSAITHLSVLTAAAELVLIIVGPSFQSSIFGNASYEVKSRDEQHVVGVIRRENEHFLVSFPVDLDVVVKALLLGGCFYLDSLITSTRAQLLNRTSSD